MELVKDFPSKQKDVLQARNAPTKDVTLSWLPGSNGTHGSFGSTSPRTSGTRLYNRTRQANWNQKNLDRQGQKIPLPE